MINREPVMDAGPRKGSGRRTKAVVLPDVLGSCKARFLGLWPSKLSLTSCQITFSSKYGVSRESYANSVVKIKLGNNSTAINRCLGK